ncbi:MAG TPA: GNAT family N-acetyltransferase [Xanthobacteraceae bacterium]|nr:GNAT family N-acetyltransferase [Xanthobacteraceae bacterium]
MEKCRSDEAGAATLRVRPAQPADIPALMRLKLLLAEGENAQHAVRASAAAWLRDGFGEQAGFCAFVAEEAAAVIGMATCSRRVITGWDGPVIFLQDLFVEPAHRRRGIAGALVARVAAYACELGSPIVELTVRADNPAQSFYRQSGFALLPQCLTYVLAGPQLAALANRDQQNQTGTPALTLFAATAPPIAPRADPTAA